MPRHFIYHLISHDIIAINCQTAMGQQSNTIVAALPLHSLHDLNFIATVAEARWLLLSIIISVRDLLLWKKLPQCHHCTMTLSRMQPKAISSALLSAMLLLPLDNTTAVANAYWLLIVIFGCCWDLSFSRKLPGPPITICIVNTYYKTLPSLLLVLLFIFDLFPMRKKSTSSLKGHEK